MENTGISKKRAGAMALCVLLSLLLHLFLLSLLILTDGSGKSGSHSASLSQNKRRHLRVQRNKKPTARKNQQESPHRPFAKTSADTPQALPEQPDFEGSRNTRAASAPDAEHLRSEEAAPAQQGEKKDELVTFEQERQDGDLAHEGQRPQRPPTPPLPPAPQPDITEQPQQDIPPAQGQENSTGTTPQPEAGDKTDTPAPITPSAAPHEPDSTGELLLKNEKKEEVPPTETTPSTATAQGTASGTGQAPIPQRKRQKKHPVFYDPSLATPQPDTIGFRTQERRSRSTGRFVMGRGAALNVTATPLGRYESEIYRRIAYHWYQACDEHRGDIIPGSITVSIRINKRGQLENMDLVRRHGAGVIQQSFTFRSIRRATLPPMPSAVRQEVVGELLELIFTFNFD